MRRYIYEGRRAAHQSAMDDASTTLPHVVMSDDQQLEMLQEPLVKMFPTKPLWYLGPHAATFLTGAACAVNVPMNRRCENS
jgi:hypothetical protein